jgi:hypothetical protein
VRFEKQHGMAAITAAQSFQGDHRAERDESHPPDEGSDYREAVEYEIEFPADGGPVDVAVTLSGEMSQATFRELMEALANDARYRAGLALLVDVSALEPIEITTEAAAMLTAPVLARDWDYPPRAVAIVAPDDDTFAAASTYRAHLGGSKSKRQVFRMHAEAIAWLEENRRS